MKNDLSHVIISGTICELPKYIGNLCEFFIESKNDESVDQWMIVYKQFDKTFTDGFFLGDSVTIMGNLRKDKDLGGYIETRMVRYGR